METTMQVRLIIVNDVRRNGQVVPVDVSTFRIGQAKNCHLRSRDPQVGQLHCVLYTQADTVTIQDLKSEHGTYVNGNRISSRQTLKNGDELKVGTHTFVVSIAATQGEATPATPTIPAAQETAAEPELMFEIRLDGQRVSVTKSRLFRLAQSGAVLPDDLIVVAGTKVFADSIKGIVFGSKPSEAASPHSAAIPKPKPYVYPDFGGSESDPFNIQNEPRVRVDRDLQKKESVHLEIGNALDTAVSRINTPEVKSFAVGAGKAFGAVLVVVCLLGVVWYLVYREKTNSYGAVYLEGTLTLDGIPMEKVNVNLIPRNENGSVAGGMTDKRGRFTVTTGPATVGTGAKPGEYDITFSKIEMESGVLPTEGGTQQAESRLPKKKYVIPQKYEDPATSGIEPIQVDTNKGKNKFKFDLTSE